jgi:hypothetical protein
MGYYLDAIIGPKPVNIEVAKSLGLPLIFEGDYVIIPLIESNIYHYEIENNIDAEDWSENVSWDRSTIGIFAKLLGFPSYVISSLRDDYFYACYYKNGLKKAHDIQLNEALKLLGVKAGNSTEFDQLNMDNYRQSEVYYWDFKASNNEAPNVIKGQELVPDYSKE